jgi:hypothetical protein
VVESIREGIKGVAEFGERKSNKKYMRRGQGMMFLYGV